MSGLAPTPLGSKSDGQSDAPFPCEEGLTGTSAKNARLGESGSVDFVLDVFDAGRVDRADLVQLERPTVEPLE